MQLCPLEGAATASAEQGVPGHAHRRPELSGVGAIAEKIDAHKWPREGLLPSAVIPTQLGLLSPCYLKTCSGQTHPDLPVQSAAHTATLRLRLVSQAVAPTGSTQQFGQARLHRRIWLLCRLAKDVESLSSVAVLAGLRVPCWLFA